MSFSRGCGSSFSDCGTMSTTTTTIAASARASVRDSSTSSTNRERTVNIIGIVVAVVACIVFVVVMVFFTWYMRSYCLEVRRSAAAAAAAAASGSDAGAPERRSRERKRAYLGVPLYPTTQLVDEEEVGSVPAFEDIPEATPGPIPQLHIRVIPAVAAAAMTTTNANSAAHPYSGEAAVLSSRAPAAAAVVVNPLSPSSTSMPETEVCMGVVVPEMSEEEIRQGESRWYTRRDYGTATYYSQPPASE